MDINDFVKNFAEQFDETDFRTFRSQTVFRNIDEWSSLTALSVIAMVDDKYGVKLSGSDILNSKTIADIYNIVNLKLINK